MTTTAQLMAKHAVETSSLQRELAETKAKLDGFEKRAAAEAILVEALAAPGAHAMRPVSVQDFIQRRDQIAAHGNMETVKLAMTMASTGDFAIGSPSSQGQPVSSMQQAELSLMNMVNSYS